LNFSIRINIGLQDGVRPNMPLVTPNGLVGHVTEVFSSTSKVKLLVDSTSAAAAMVQRPQSRAVGIIEGLTAPTTGLRLKNLTRDADIIKGDKVMTSGFGGIYPKGLLIGEVADVADDDGGLLKHAIIKPAVDYDRLEEVFVVIGEKRAVTP
jgi:rod shape-determining protein MreC